MQEKLRWVANHFGSIQIALVALIALTLFWLRSKSPESQFSVREADRKKTEKDGKPKRVNPEKDALANAKLQVKRTLQLPGIRIDGKPHEVLGVRYDAPESEIREAYKKLMLQYHPDKIGPPGSQQWQDAQKIAAALNEARSAMLAARSTQGK